MSSFHTKTSSFCENFILKFRHFTGRTAAGIRASAAYGDYLLTAFSVLFSIETAASLIEDRSMTIYRMQRRIEATGKSVPLFRSNKMLFYPISFANSEHMGVFHTKLPLVLP